MTMRNWRFSAVILPRQADRVPPDPGTKRIVGPARSLLVIVDVAARIFNQARSLRRSAEIISPHRRHQEVCSRNPKRQNGAFLSAPNDADLPRRATGE